MTKRVGLVLIVLLLAAMGGHVVSADGPVAARPGRSEMRFLEGMIDHHQMALDMAADCLKKATTESVKKLCQNIIDAQKAEIEMMRGWLLSWYKIDYQPVSMASMAGDASGGHSGGHNDQSQDAKAVKEVFVGMMGMMAGFANLQGREYEIAWLESMIDHHDDALHMSDRILKTAEHKELVALAKKIIESQSAEIKMMETMIADFLKAK